MSAALRLPLPWSTMACQAAGREKEDGGIAEVEVEEAGADTCSDELLAYERVGSDMTTGGQGQWAGSRRSEQKCQKE